MPKAVEMTYLEAVNAALRRALTEDNKVIVYGEDVGKPGGVFGATKGLAKIFPGRVFDTPISEAAILGSAVGASMVGMRPVVEIMWVDFSLVALDQIVNQAANIRFASNGTLGAPLTIRTQQGALPGSCAQHSQCLEAFFGHVPGLRVCLPSTPDDAYKMLLSSIRCDDPTLVIEHRSLYGTPPGEVHIDGPIESPGSASVVRSGSDVTVVTWGSQVAPSLEAAAMAGEEGSSVEVIDLRWISPLDDVTVLESVLRTGRLVVVHEANVTGGFGAEIVARVAERIPGTPIRRVGTLDTRIPAHPLLQKAVLPNVERIVAAIRETCRASMTV